MNLLRNTSIKRKQMLIITLTSTASLLLACVGFVLHDTATFRKELVEKNSSLAEVVGNSCSAALDFNDQKTAGELLTALRGEMNITDTFIMSRDGGEFASYHAGKQHSALPKSTDMKNSDHVFTSDRLFLSRPIVQRDETLGTIIIVSDLAGLQKRMSSYVGIVVAVLAMSLLTTLLLSSRLQRVVSDPILHLAVTARKVAMEKNYSVRAVKQSDDEIGQLIDGFNEMLTQIQASNSALQLARDHLELRVQQRTAELADSFSLLNLLVIIHYMG